MNYLNFDFASMLSYVYNIFAGVMGILLIIARWMLFEKAGEQGWASIIPFYNRYCLFKVSKRTELFWWWLGAQVASIVAYVVVVVDFVIMLIHGLGRIGGGSYGSAAYSRDMVILIIFLILIILTGIANIVFHAILCGGLAEVFEKTTGFAVGLFFLPCVFYCILAFSSRIKYVGDEQVSYGAQGYDTYNAQGYDAYNAQGYDAFSSQTQEYDVYGQQNKNDYES